MTGDGSAAYFSNHAAVKAWPFTLYHGPLERDLAATVARIRARRGDALNILVFGCGLFHESPLYPAGATVLLVDADPRLGPILAAQAGGPRREVLICGDPAAMRRSLSARLGRFDLIVCKEVIEHLADAPPYLALFRELLTSEGTLWVSTPNYGDVLLPLIEYSFLEVVARLKGFSRFHIHPNKYSRAKLRTELAAAGFPNVVVRMTPARLALVGCAKKTEANR